MDAFNFDAYRGSHRMVLVFAPSERAPAFEKQMDLIRADEQGLHDQDVFCVTVLAEGRSDAGGHAIRETDAVALRERFGVGRDDFAVILLGKDGSVKRETDAPLQIEAILEQIEGAPAQDRDQRRSQDG